MAHQASILVLGAIFLYLLTTMTVSCQTFHYSHGWTNGKRASMEAVPGLTYVTPSMKSIETRFDNLQRSKLPRIEGNANDAFYLFTCELLHPLQKILHQNTNTGAPFRRESTAENNNENY